MSRHWIFAAALLSGCSTSGSFKGQLEPQLGMEMPEDLRIIASAQPAATDLTCQSFEARPDAAGAFVLDGLCAETTYKLKLSDKNMLIEGDHSLMGGSSEAPTTLMKVWPAPVGSGLYMLSSGDVKSLATYTDVKKLQLLDTQETVLYPRHKPNSSVRVEEGSHLIIAGDANIERLAFSPLVEETVTRNFNDGYSLGAHFYVGLRFSSDTEVERVEAALETSKVVTVAGADLSLRYVAHDALPPGHYALMGEGDQRMYVITFGPEPSETVSEN